MKTFKEADLILYLYEECSPAMKARIELALEEDIMLQDRLKILKRTLRQLDKLKLQSPAKHTLKTVLDYAKGKKR